MVAYTEWDRLDIAQELGIIVDSEDAWLLTAYTWAWNGGYIRTQLPRPSTQKVSLHHCIVGQPINGMDVDHIDRNRANNSRSNLRYLSRSGNNLNSDRSDGAYYIREVEYGYRVEIKRGGIRHYIGIFDTIAEAEEARDQWLSAQET